MNTRKLIIRIAAVLVLIGVAAVMMVIGRGHTVYLDNKSVDYNGETYSAFHKVEVYVKGERVAKLGARERGSAPWIGQSFRMELLVTADKDGEAQSYAVQVALPYGMDGVMINLPALLQGLPEDAWLSEFVLAVEAEPEGEEMEPGLEDDMGLGDEFNLE